MQVNPLLLLLLPCPTVVPACLIVSNAYFFLAQKFTMLITGNKIPKFHSFFLKTSVDEKR